LQSKSKDLASANGFLQATGFQSIFPSVFEPGQLGVVDNFKFKERNNFIELPSHWQGSGSESGHWQALK
jgi:hypothetical protein